MSSLTPDNREPALETLIDTLPPEKQQHIRTYLVQHRFSGPLPHPDHLAAYEQISPGAAKTIITIMVEETSHRQIMDKEILQADKLEMQNFFKAFGRGQICALITALTCILCATILGAIGRETTAGILAGTSLIGIVTAFLAGTKRPASN